MTVTELQDLAQNGAKPEFVMFSACANGNGSIMISGGKNQYGKYSREATRLDLVNDDEIEWVLCLITKERDLGTHAAEMEEVHSFTEVIIGQHLQRYFLWKTDQTQVEKLVY